MIQFEMFYKLFWPSPPDECFICCSVDGKSDSDKQFELFFNQKYGNYPLIKLSQAYDCNCRNMYAHNRCLLHIHKCPTCRKTVVKPNLYVKTRYDYYLWFLLDWVKKDATNIEKIKWYAMTTLVIFCLILYLLDKNKEALYVIIPPKSNKSLFLAIVLGSMYFLSLYTIILDDYFKKYWLYDFKNKKCLVF